MADTLTVPEAAERLGLTTREVYALVDGGELPATTGRPDPARARRVLITAEALDTYQQRTAKR